MTFTFPVRPVTGLSYFFRLAPSDWLRDQAETAGASEELFIETIAESVICGDKIPKFDFDLNGNSIVKGLQTFNFRHIKGTIDLYFRVFQQMKKDENKSRFALETEAAMAGLAEAVTSAITMMSIVQPINLDLDSRLPKEIE